MFSLFLLLLNPDQFFIDQCTMSEVMSEHLNIGNHITLFLFPITVAFFKIMCADKPY